MNLSNWNPFKFARKKEESKEQSSRGSASTTLAPHDAMQRMMQSLTRDPFFSAPSAFAAALPENRWFGDFSPSVFQPNVDVVDEGKALRITAELPGLSEDDIELSADDGALTIKGEKKTDANAEEDGCYRTERAYGYFQRVVPLPAEASPDGVEANFEKGVLTVRVPKKKETSSAAKRIPIGRK